MSTESCVYVCVNCRDTSAFNLQLPASVVSDSVSSRQRSCDAEASLTEMGSEADRRSGGATPGRARSNDVLAPPLDRRKPDWALPKYSGEAHHEHLF